MKRITLGLTMVIACGAQAWGQQGSTARCDAMTAVTLDHAKVTQAALATAAELKEMEISRPEAMPAFCRVQVTDTPSEDSEIKTEIWLPMSGWNGKLRAQGNGGFAGTIYLKAMAETVRQGYATVGTDTGHVGG